MQYPESRVSSLEDLAAFPVGVREKLLPLKSLVEIRFEEVFPAVYRSTKES